MKLTLSLALIVLSAFTASSEKARYDNYRVYTVEIDTHDQLSVLKEISEKSDSYSFWESPVNVKSSVEIVVPPHKFAHFSEIMEKFNFNTNLIDENWQETIEKERPTKQRKAEALIDWQAYYSHDEINAWVESLKEEFPQWISVEDIGHSYEGRRMKVVKLSKKANNRAIFIEANIHAREWIASATSTFVLNQLLRSDNPEVQYIAENVDWYIIPMSNPDGYEYTRSTNRNWRKTRTPVSATCYGVDPNRNFEYNWLIPDESGNLGASTAPCSDTYAGPHPFSEDETIAIERYLENHPAQFDVYLSFHSYAHQILFPMGNSRVRVSNYAHLQAIGEAAADRLYSKHGVRYEVGNSLEVLYATSGTSVDHSMGHHKIPIGYTYEMRGNGDYGRYGFVLPPQFIIPNGEEVLESLIGLVGKSQELGYLGKTN